MYLVQLGGLGLRDVANVRWDTKAIKAEEGMNRMNGNEMEVRMMELYAGRVY